MDMKNGKIILSILIHRLPWVGKGRYICEGKKGQVPHSGGEAGYELG